MCKRGRGGGQLPLISLKIYALYVRLFASIFEYAASAGAIYSLRIHSRSAALFSLSLFIVVVLP